MDKKTLSAAIVLLAIFASILVWYFLDEIRMVPYAPSLKTHQWDTDFSRSDLQIRKVRNDELDFLIKPTEREKEFSTGLTNSAYLFKPTTKEFKLVPQEVWDTAEGEIKTCPMNLSNSKPQYDAYGWYPLVASMDSKGERAAVISAAGPAIPPVFSFPSGQATGRILGTRYFEVFDQRRGKAKGGVVRMKGLDDSQPLMCWTPDDNFVVIHNGFFSSLFVVDVTAL